VRTTKTFILRLLINSDDPGTLRGAVQQMPEGQVRQFTDGQALLASLQQLARQQQEEKKEARP